MSLNHQGPVSQKILRQIVDVDTITICRRIICETGPSSPGAYDISKGKFYMFYF